MDNNPAIKVPFYNLQVNNLTENEFFAALLLQLDAGDTVTVNFLNAHCFNIAQSEPNYRDALNACTFLLNDGIGVDIAGWLKGLSFKENLNGTDLIPKILALAARRASRVFFLGARQDVIETAVRNARLSQPSLNIVGFSHGYVEDSDSLIDTINQANPDIVVVGMGVPMQELWVRDHAASMEQVRLFVCGGAIFDFISGKTMRAPVVVRKLRLEWLFRLFREPVRLFSRYVTGSFRFLINIMKLW